VITRSLCHSEEPQAVLSETKEESRTALRILRARFLAPLGMTALKRFHTDSPRERALLPGGFWQEKAIAAATALQN